MRHLFSLVLLFTTCFSAFAFPINIEGFEQGDTGACQSVTGSQAINSTIVRTGNYSFRVNPTTTATGTCRIAALSTAGQSSSSINTASLYRRFYFYIATAPASGDEEIYTVLDTAGANKASFRLNFSRQIVTYDSTPTLVATGATVLTTATWYRIEILTSTGAGAQSYEVKVNGVSELSGTMTQGTVNHGSDRVGKNVNRSSQSIDVYYDDISIDNSAFPGAGEIKTVLPLANGSSMTWITVPSGTANQTQVTDRPTNDDTSYLGSTTSGAALFTFQSTTTAGISGTINAVKLFTRFREEVDAAATTVLRIRSSATNSDSISNNIGLIYLNRYRLLVTDPATSVAWTTGGIDAVEGGLNEGTASQVNRLTTVNMQVDYIPSVATTLRVLASTGVGQ